MRELNVSFQLSFKILSNTLKFRAIAFFPTGKHPAILWKMSCVSAIARIEICFSSEQTKERENETSTECSLIARTSHLMINLTSSVYFLMNITAPLSHSQRQTLESHDGETTALARRSWQVAFFLCSFLTVSHLNLATIHCIIF